jgi:hypothetical protein
MTAAQNNFLGPAALIFSCCFPAKNGWDTEIRGLHASHELADADALIAEQDCLSDYQLFDRVRRTLLFGGTTLRIY